MKTLHLAAFLLLAGCASGPHVKTVSYGDKDQAFGDDPVCSCFLASDPHIGYCEERCGAVQCASCLKRAAE